MLDDLTTDVDWQIIAGVNSRFGESWIGNFNRLGIVDAHIEMPEGHIDLIQRAISLYETLRVAVDRSAIPREPISIRVKQALPIYVRPVLDGWVAYYLVDHQDGV